MYHVNDIKIHFSIILIIEASEKLDFKHSIFCGIFTNFGCLNQNNGVKDGRSIMDCKNSHHKCLYIYTDDMTIF